MTEALVAGVVALVVAAGTSLTAFVLQREQLRQELRTEFMAEQALVGLLDHADWTLRSFERISKHVGGFDDDELRRMLVRAGALRFESSNGVELWGLRHRNLDRLKTGRPAPLGTRKSLTPGDESLG